MNNNKHPVHPSYSTVRMLRPVEGSVSYSPAAGAEAQPTAPADAAHPIVPVLRQRPTATVVAIEPSPIATSEIYRKTQTPAYSLREAVEIACRTAVTKSRGTA